jgi:septal ring factor EnvC (AmiA/AmiB activator)
VDNILNTQLLAPILVALVSAASTYFVIINKTRTEFAAQTKNALDTFRAKTETADINDRIAFRAEQREEMQELRQKIKEHELNKADMVTKLAGAQANITILEARVRVLEQALR